MVEALQVRLPPLRHRRLLLLLHLRPGLPRAGVHLALTATTRGVRRRRGPPPRAATPPAAAAHATAEAAPRLRHRRAARRPRHRRRVLLLAAARQGAGLRIRCRRARSPDLEVLQRRGGGGSSASEVRVVPRVAPAAVAVTEAPRGAGDTGAGGGRGRREREDVVANTEGDRSDCAKVP